MSLSFSPLRRRFLDPTRGSVARPNLARTPSRADDRRSLSHHEHEQGEIACTGRVRFPWCETRVAVAALARGAMARAARRAASKAFAANHPGDARECDSADPSSSSSPPAAELDEAVARAEAQADALETRLASFPEPPFTAQRLVELLLDPEASGYSTPEKLRVAAEKTLAVTGMTAIAAPSGLTSGALDPEPHARRALDPVSLEQSAFVRALVGEAELQRGEDEGEDCSLVREKRQKIARGETTNPPETSRASESASPPPYAAFPGEALPVEEIPGGFVAEVLDPRPAMEVVERASVGEKRAREGESPEPTFAEEMDVLERRLPGKPDVGAELVTAGA